MFELHSRIHRIPTFDTSRVTVYVKRDDELGFGISGSKMRKYHSLLPYLVAEKPDEVVTSGSPYSNHLFGLTQLLRENRLHPVLFMVGDKPSKPQGNYLFTSLLAPTVHWVQRNQPTMIDEYFEKRKSEGKKVIVIPPGGSCEEALAGTLTLARDIVRNEKEAGVVFDHIFIDSGTGFTAQTLILAFGYMGKSTHIHVVLVAGREDEFELNLKRWQPKVESLIPSPLPYSPYYTLHSPEDAASFGATNRGIFETIREIAAAEGFLTDPIYTVKLFREGKKLLPDLKGNVLFIHSGGALTLAGFQAML